LSTVSATLRAAQVFQIGDSLREARTRRGLSAADVHKGIRIRERYLTALEEERWDMLPGEAYTKGFLRTYAEFLGLNGNLYIDEYNTRFAHRGEEPLVLDALAAGGRSRSAVLRVLAGIVVVGAGVAGLAAWRLGGGSTPQRPAFENPVHAAAASSPAVSKPKTTKPAATAAPVALKPAFAILSAPRGRSWLLVRAWGPNGTILYEGFLEQGMTKRFALQHTLWVRLGRPDVVDVKVAGRVLKQHSANPANVLLTRKGAQAA
jgi:cytoskeleton protein RodZ